MNVLVFPAGTTLFYHFILLLSFAFCYTTSRHGRLQDVQMIPIKANSRGWCLSDRSLHFASVVDLVMYYRRHSLLEVTPALGVALSYPVKRPEVHHCKPMHLTPSKGTRPTHILAPHTYTQVPYTHTHTTRTHTHHTHTHTTHTHTHAS